MHKKILKLFIFSFLFTTFVALPSSAVKTLAEVLKNRNLPELEAHIASLDKQQVLDALQYIDTLNPHNWFLEAARDWLFTRLAELEDEEEQSIEPMDFEGSAEDSSSAPQSYTSGGGGQSDDDDSPSLGFGSPSNPSIFGTRPSPWNAANFLAESLSELLGPQHIELPQPTHESSPPAPNLQTEFRDVGRIIDFSPVSFLEEAVKKLEDSVLRAKIEAFLADKKGRDLAQTIDLCWRAILKLKTQLIVSENLGDLPFAYMTMAKLLLATQMPPAFEVSADFPILSDSPQETYNRLNSYLRNRFLQFNLDETRQANPDKIYKWSLIYHALLSMEQVRRNPGNKNNLRTIAEAYNFLEKANALKTTKSSHVFLIHLYLDHGDLLGYNKEEIEAFVAKELDSFHQKTPSLHKKQSHSNQETPSFWSLAAQPPYYRNQAVQEDVRLLHAQMAQDAALPQGHPEISTHVTQMDSAAAESLPPRIIDANYLLEQRSSYAIRGQTFTNFNVSGRDFRCFFNSLGLNAANQVKLLLENQHNPQIRAMIANEIVSAWRTYYQLPQALRAQLNARDLIERQARVDRLTASDSQQDLRQQLQIEQEAILKEFRARASSVKSFKSFVTHQIGTRIDGDSDAPYPMMVMQHDVQGEEQNDLPNLSAIDAIALVNGIGIRVFTIRNDNLRPVHTFIPQDATTVAHLVYLPEAEHFTALIPSPDAMDIDGESTSISNLSNENGARRKTLFDDQTINAIFDAYLSSGYGPNGRSEGDLEITNLVAEHVGIAPKFLRKYIVTILKPYTKRVLEKRGEVTAQERSSVVSSYTNGQSFSSIHAETKLPYMSILDILLDHLPPHLRPNIIDVSELPAHESSSERNNRIVDAFHFLTDKDGKAPSGTEVSRHTGCSLKVTLKALKQAGLIAHTNRAKHLSEEQMEQIKAEYETMRAQGGKPKYRIYHEIADKFGFKFNRIESFFRGTIYSDATGIKRKHHVSPNDIQAAYFDLSPQERPDALRLLSRLLNCSERQVADALDAIGVQYSRDTGTKKARRE